MLRYFANIKYIILLSLAITLGACSADTDGNDAPAPPTTGNTPVELQIQLGCGSVAAKSSATEKDPLDNEKIHTWWVAFVNRTTGLVAAIREGAPAAPVEEDKFKIELDPGNYRVYAFANISRDELATYASVTFSPGSAPQGDPDNAQFSGFDATTLTGGLMPMSGYLDIEANEVNIGHSIEVVRMYAKVELQFTNAGSAPLTIDSWEFGPLHSATAKLPLMPDYTTLGGAPAISDGGDTGMRTASVATPLAVGAKLSSQLYTREIVSTHSTDNFLLNVFTTASGATTRRHALAFQLKHINRNDWITIPVKLTDWLLDIDVKFYPPIGGYPAVMLSSDADQYYATFSSSGKFVITPRVRPIGGELLAPDQYTLLGITVDDPDNIFSKQPQPQTTKEIVGELATGNVRGRATVTLQLEVTDSIGGDDNGGEGNSEPAVAVTHTISRTIYIIRQ